LVGVGCGFGWWVCEAVCWSVCGFLVGGFWWGWFVGWVCGVLVLCHPGDLAAPGQRDSALAGIANRRPHRVVSFSPFLDIWPAAASSMELGNCSKQERRTHADLLQIVMIRRPRQYKKTTAVQPPIKRAAYALYRKAVQEVRPGCIFWWRRRALGTPPRFLCKRESRKLKQLATASDPSPTGTLGWPAHDINSPRRLRARAAPQRPIAAIPDRRGSLRLGARKFAARHLCTSASGSRPKETVRPVQNPNARRLTPERMEVDAGLQSSQSMAKHPSRKRPGAWGKRLQGGPRPPCLIDDIGDQYAARIKPRNKNPAGVVDQTFQRHGGPPPRSRSTFFASYPRNRTPTWRE